MYGRRRDYFSPSSSRSRTFQVSRRCRTAASSTSPKAWERFLESVKKRGTDFQILLRFEKYKKRNLKKYSKNHLHSKGKCAIIQQLYPCNAYGEVLKWSKRRDTKSRRAVTRRVGSNPTFSANKKRTFVYQKFSFCLSKPQAWHIITARSVVYIIKGAMRPCISSRASVHFPAA